MAITFDYAVKYNGKYYPPNAHIEEAATKANRAEGGENIEPKTEAPKRAARGRKKGDA